MRDAGDEQRAREPVGYGGEHRVEIGFGAEAAAEFDQRLAVVVASAVEDAIDAGLNSALERIEKLRGDDDGGDEAPGAEAGQILVDQLCRNGDRAEIQSDERSRRERVSDAALEDEVHVHEPVADDGPGEGERQKDEAEPGDLVEDGRHRPVCEEGYDLQKGEGDDREQSAARKPLQLLAT